MRKLQKTGEPFSLRPSKGFYRHPVIGTTENGTDSDDQYVYQFVFLVPVDPRIGEFSKILQQSGGALPSHT